jgi:hypothetical protein
MALTRGLLSNAPSLGRRGCRCTLRLYSGCRWHKGPSACRRSSRDTGRLRRCRRAPSCRDSSDRRPAPPGRRRPSNCTIGGLRLHLQQGNPPRSIGRHTTPLVVRNRCRRRSRCIRRSRCKRTATVRRPRSRHRRRRRASGAGIVVSDHDGLRACPGEVAASRATRDGEGGETESGDAAAHEGKQREFHRSPP